MISAGEFLSALQSTITFLDRPLSYDGTLLGSGFGWQPGMPAASTGFLSGRTPDASLSSLVGPVRNYPSRGYLSVFSGRGFDPIGDTLAQIKVGSGTPDYATPFMQGAQLAVGAPMPAQNPSPFGEGSMPVAGNMSADLGGGGDEPPAAASDDDAEEPKKPEEAKPIPEEKKTEAAKKLVGASKGYDTKEAEAIVARAAKAANGDEKKFNDIVSGVPKRDLELTETEKGDKKPDEIVKAKKEKRAKYYEALGEWSAKNFTDVPEKEAKDFVRQFAFKTTEDGDYVQIQYAGLEEDGYEKYTVKDGKGAEGNALKGKVVFRKDGEWFKKKDDGYEAIEVRYIEGLQRLSFGDGEVEPVKGVGEDIATWFRAMDEGLVKYDRGLRATDAEKKKIAKDRFEKFKATLPEDMRGKVEYNEDTKEITITVDITATDEDNKKFVDAAKLATNSTAINNAFKYLTAEMGVKLNGNTVPRSEAYGEIGRIIESEKKKAEEPEGETPVKANESGAAAADDDGGEIPTTDAAFDEDAARLAEAEPEEEEKKESPTVEPVPVTPPAPPASKPNASTSEVDDSEMINPSPQPAVPPAAPPPVPVAAPK